MLMNVHQTPAVMEIVLTHLDPITVNVTLDSRGLLRSKHVSTLMSASRMGSCVKMADA